MDVVVKFKRLSPLAMLPTRGTPGSSGFDVHAAVEMPVVIDPWQCQMIPLGFSCEIPEGFEIQLRPRSSIGKKKVTIPNSPATIDNDFRGPMVVMLYNMSDDPFVVECGHRIAQMVLAKVPVMVPQWADELTPTERGDGGFGSTGR